MKKSSIVNVEGDELGGISISIRERDDLIEIWNTRSDLHEQSTVIDKVKDLLTEVNFSAIFYKGEEKSLEFYVDPCTSAFIKQLTIKPVQFLSDFLMKKSIIALC